ncbi:MAG TPA: glycine oxidase ThiO [Planctomycetales bacterium]|jgi:glycine oxidase|nr:glycine oxidase ThiO [Planctomycetales bacterium]
MTDHADVLIVGGGVIGLTTAYFLAQEGVRVTLIDKGDFGREASWAGAGIIPPGDSRRAIAPIDHLRSLSSEMYPDLSRRLREQTGIDNGYHVCGGLDLVEPGEAFPIEEWRAEGIAFREVMGDALRAVEPGLSPALARAYHLPGMAQVRTPRHVKALLAACEAQGVQLYPHRAATGFVRTGRRIDAVQTEQGPLLAGRFLVTAGAWTDGLVQQVGCRLGVRPVRGQIALLQTDDARQRLILLKGKRYLVPRGDGLVLVGATEEDVGFDARPTASAIAGLLAFAAELVPSLAGAALERCWAGLRPGSPDGLPFLGAVPNCPNLYVAAGHFRAGIQLSPASGRAMTDLLIGREPVVSLKAFRLDRPPAPPIRTAFRS